MSREIVFNNAFVASLYDIKLNKSQRHIKDLNRAGHFVNHIINMVDSEKDEINMNRLENLKSYLVEKTNLLNERVNKINEIWENSDGENLAVINHEKFTSIIVKPKWDNKIFNHFLKMLLTIDNSTTQIHILYFNKKIEKKDYYSLLKDIANPFRSTMDWLYKDQAEYLKQWKS